MITKNEQIIDNSTNSAYSFQDDDLLNRTRNSMMINADFI